MKNEVQILIEKACDCIESSSLNLENGFYDASVNRSYYAIFDAVTALLISKNITVKSHSGSIQQFALHFIKTGNLKKELQDHLVYCYQKRQVGDYDLYSEISKEEANLCLQKAKEFVNAAKDWLEIST